MAVAVCWDVLAASNSAKAMWTMELLASLVSLILTMCAILPLYMSFTSYPLPVSTAAGYAVLGGLSALSTLALMHQHTRYEATAGEDQPNKLIRTLVFTTAGCAVLCIELFTRGFGLGAIGMIVLLLAYVLGNYREFYQLNAPKLVKGSVVLFAALVILSGLLHPSPEHYVFKGTPSNQPETSFADTKSTVSPVIITWIESEADQKSCSRLLMSLFDTMVFSPQIPRVFIIADDTDDQFETKATALGDVTVVHRQGRTTTRAMVELLNSLRLGAHGQVALVDPRVVFRAPYSPAAYRTAGVKLPRDGSWNTIAIVQGGEAIGQLTGALTASDDVPSALLLLRDTVDVTPLTRHDVVHYTSSTIAARDEMAMLATAGRVTMFHPGDAPPPPLTRPLKALDPTYGTDPGTFLPLMYMLLDERWGAGDWVGGRRRPFDPADDGYIIWVTANDFSYAGFAVTFLFSLRRNSEARIILLTDSNLSHFAGVTTILNELHVEVVELPEFAREDMVKIATTIDTDVERFAKTMFGLAMLNINQFLSASGRRVLRRMVAVDIDMLAVGCPDAMFEHPSPMVFTKDMMPDWPVNSGVVKYDIGALNSRFAGDKTFYDHLLEFARDPVNCCQFPDKFWFYSDQEVLACYSLNVERNVPLLGTTYNQFDVPMGELIAKVNPVYNDTKFIHFAGWYNNGPGGRPWNQMIGTGSVHLQPYLATVECLSGRPRGCFERMGRMVSVRPNVCARCQCPHRPVEGALEISLPDSVSDSVSIFAQRFDVCPGIVACLALRDVSHFLKGVFAKFSLLL